MNSNNQWLRNGFVYLLILVTLAALAFNIFQQPRKTETVSISQLADDIKAGLVQKVSINGSTVSVTYNDQHQATANLSRNTNSDFISTMKDLGVSSDQLTKAHISYEQQMQWDNIIAL